MLTIVYPLVAVFFLLAHVPEYQQRFLVLFEYARLRHVFSIVMSYTYVGLNVARNQFYQPTDSKSKQSRQRLFHDFVQFMRESGSGEIFRTGVWNRRFPVNLLILQQVHKRMYKYLHEDSNDLSSDATIGSDVCDRVLAVSARMLRFATAIYGHDIVAACEFESSMDTTSTWKQFRRPSQAMCDVTGCQRSDILVRNWPYGGTTEFTNHTVVVDHKSQSIIIAVRGTSCFTDMLVDMVGNTTDFCGGQAHGGMARMARATWAKATESHGPNFDGIADDYDIVLTGHSLGAGVASLMTIMVLHEKLVDTTQRSVRCFAYAPPATFHGHLPDNIKNNMTAFTYGNDVVPYISVHSALHLNACLVAVDQERESMTYWQTFRLAMGWSEPSSHLMDTVSTMSVESIEGALPMVVPAGKTFSIRRVGSEYRILERVRVQGHPIILAGLDMFLHHTVGKYDVAFRRILSPRQNFRNRMSTLLRKSVSFRNIHSSLPFRRSVKTGLRRFRASMLNPRSCVLEKEIGSHFRPARVSKRTQTS